MIDPKRKKLFRRIQDGIVSRAVVCAVHVSFSRLWQRVFEYLTDLEADVKEQREAKVLALFRLEQRSQFVFSL